MLNKNKRGDMKIKEMAFVLIAVVLLFGIIFLFFVRFQITNLQKTVTDIREQRNVEMLRVVASLPELRCSSSFSSATEIACIDKNKVLAFKNSNIQTFYLKLWQSSNIQKVEIRDIMSDKNKNYIIYEDPKRATSTTSDSTFIPLCEETSGQSQCTVAKIIITTKVP